MISDCELFWLRRPFQYRCQDGYFLWLRAWHETHYDGSPLVGGLQGYAFHVLVTGLRRGGWDPDVGCFFLEHPPHLGVWPAHYTRMAVWQMLLSVALGPAFCVCRPSYVSVCHSQPYGDVVLPSSWLSRGGGAERSVEVPQGVSDPVLLQPRADYSSDDSCLSSLDMEA